VIKIAENKTPSKCRGDKNAEGIELIAERKDEQYTEVFNHKKEQDNHSTKNNQQG
jgi:hypothetical protein